MHSYKYEEMYEGEGEGGGGGFFYTCGENALCPLGWKAHPYKGWFPLLRTPSHPPQKTESPLKREGAGGLQVINSDAPLNDYRQLEWVGPHLILLKLELHRRLNVKDGRIG